MGRLHSAASAAVMCALTCAPACSDPRPLPVVQRAAPVVPSTARVWFERMTSTISKWRPPEVVFGVKLHNGSDAAAWFMLRVHDGSYAYDPGERLTLREVKLHVQDLGLPVDEAARVYALALCDGSWCDVAIYLPADHRVSYFDTKRRHTSDGKFIARVWKLTGFDLDGVPAETWISRKLIFDLWSAPDHEYSAAIDQVDLVIGERWEFALDVKAS